MPEQNTDYLTFSLPPFPIPKTNLLPYPINIPSPCPDFEEADLRLVLPSPHLAAS